MTDWTNPQYAGYLPQIFLEDDPRTAQEQANTNYAHGGGWRSFMGRGFELGGRAKGQFNLRFSSDPALREVSRTRFHDQTLVLFESSWVAIVDANENLVDVARMD